MVPYGLPKTLYRVQLPDARTLWDPREGFAASDTESRISPRQKALFSLSISNHLFWDNPDINSLYISAFSDWEHAWNWARKMMGKRGRYSCSIIEIDVSRMNVFDFPIYHAGTLADDLGIDLLSVKRDRAQLEHEYLCLHRIPAEAIVSETPVDMSSPAKQATPRDVRSTGRTLRVATPVPVYRGPISTGSPVYKGRSNGYVDGPADVEEMDMGW